MDVCLGIGFIDSMQKIMWFSDHYHIGPYHFFSRFCVFPPHLLKFVIQIICLLSEMVVSNSAT